ncbi:hypothetical protein B0H65DRAFT_259392 [Neurospora tetraspora]|uniref:Uncharacterized protein n=1 Tax=Neurospora tetraspora TaxID=94610 RepID=A0AAE0JBV5_9PEZI|nr:hypothetical protein B0H65DRAFT_259392 [Neurospora tetraspora]
MRRKQGGSGRTATRLASWVVSRTSKARVRSTEQQRKRSPFVIMSGPQGRLKSKREITLDKTLALIGWVFKDRAIAYRVSTTEAHLFCQFHTSCLGADIRKNWRTRTFPFGIDSLKLFPVTY